MQKARINGLDTGQAEQFLPISSIKCNMKDADANEFQAEVRSI